jgi:hypothetical protein
MVRACTKIYKNSTAFLGGKKCSSTRVTSRAGGVCGRLGVEEKFPFLDKLQNIIQKIRYIFNRSFALILIHEYTMVSSSSSFTFPVSIISRTAKRISTKFGIHMQILFLALLVKYNPYFP